LAQVPQVTGHAAWMYPPKNPLQPPYDVVNAGAVHVMPPKSALTRVLKSWQTLRGGKGSGGGGDGGDGGLGGGGGGGIFGICIGVGDGEACGSEEKPWVTATRESTVITRWHIGSDLMSG